MFVDFVELKACQVEFETTQIETAETVWMDHSSKDHCAYSDEISSELQFSDMFAYVISNSDCFSKVRFNDKNRKILVAERYGGRGILDNAGGVRCGNDGSFQIKGIGKNCLVGGGQDVWHSYGGLSLFEGTMELINSKVYDWILPLGTVKCYGLIDLGENTAHSFESAYSDEDYIPIRGSLVVRATCLRSAHFLRSGHYKKNNKSDNRLSSDVHRVREANKQFYEKFESKDKLIEYIESFLSTSAKQFAFSRIFRIAHGTVTPSNISLDGKWLDLTNISFLPGGMNHTEAEVQTPFYDEPYSIIPIIQELLFTLSKYNLIELDIKPFIRFYDTRFKSELAYYSTSIFGVSSRLCTSYIFGARYQPIFRSVSALITANKKVIHEPIFIFNPKDPMVVYVEELFLSLNRDYEISADFKELLRGVQKYSAESVIKAFKEFFIKISGAQYRGEETYISFCLSSMIVSLRMLYFSSFYYSYGLRCRTDKAVKKQSVSYLKDYIDDSISVSKWLFNFDESTERVIFSSSFLKISFNPEEHTYFVKYIKVESTKSYFTACLLKEEISSLDDSYFQVHDFDFKYGLFRLLDFLIKFESRANIEF